jgi:hypothetical protein
LNTVNAVFVKRGSFGGCGRVLGLFGAINGLNPFMWRVLWAKRWRMIAFCEGTRDIAWHGDVNMTSTVVPVKSEAAVEGAGPVDGEFVVVFDGADEMESVEFGVILDAKVVNAEDTCGLSGAMAPETWGERHGFVAGGS